MKNVNKTTIIVLTGIIGRCIYRYLSNTPFDISDITYVEGQFVACLCWMIISE